MSTEGPREVPKEKEEDPLLLNYFQLFRFATAWDFFLLFISIILSTARALLLPCGIVIYSEFVAILVDRILVTGTSTKTVFLEVFGGGKVLINATEEESYSEIYNDSISYGILLTIVSVLMFITGTISIDIFNYSALRQVTKIRRQFFRSIITQDIGWHDVISDQNFATRVTDDIEKIRDGIGEKACHFLTLILGFLISAVISFIYGWKLTLAVSVYIPIVILTTICVTKYQGKLTMRESSTYARAGNILEEVLTNIKTVVAFNGEKKEADRYDNFLEPAKKAGQRRGIFTGFGDGVLRSLLFISCAGAFWYGVNLIIEDRYKEDKEYTPAILMIAFFGILVGADNISRTSPFLEAFATARGAGTNIFSIIDRESKIDPLSPEGKIVNYGLKGDIEFQDIFFKYPSREEITVLRGINIKIDSGKTVALVGYSGCGKSTCIQLIQRFYDPVFGQVLLDNHDIRKYNTAWLRSNIGVVGQEPVLFATTIGENIRYGKTNATQKEIEDAARLSGIHDFITSLPDCYNTMVGEKGAQLSGGQKQRIAIARAVVGNPKILLLDEATSALDYESERAVQQALDLARKGRTTIVVSHRLSAIKNSDKIVYIEAGKVCEEGTHEELMAIGGKYNKMVSAGGLSTLDADAENEKNLKMEFIEKNYTLELNNLHERHKSVDVEPFEFEPMLPKTVEEELDAPYGSFLETFKRILKMSKPEWCFLILGSISAALFGCTYPCFAILFGEFYAALSQTDDNKVLEDVKLLCISFLVVGIGTGIVCFIQTYLFNMSGVWLTLRIRSQVFRSIMQQEMAWFNKEKNSVGALSAQLAGDVGDFQGAIGYPLSGLIQSISNFTLGCALAFYYSWKLALLCLAIVPFVAGVVVFEARLMTKSMIEEKAILEEATRIATEAIANIRTVASLRQENHMISRYNNEVATVEKHIKKKVRLRGTVNSFGQSVLFFGYAIALCYGGVLVSQRSVQFQNIIKVSETLLYGSFMLGQSLAFMPAFTAALFAGRRLFSLLDRVPQLQSPVPDEKDDVYDQDYNTKFKHVEFRYPNRPNIPVLQGLNLEIMQGKTIGLVGHSGCGKSTCIQLLQRFYDPDNGKITVGSKDISKDISLKGLRSKLGIVSQEPVLFEKTIAENIAYGDNSREVPLPEIIDAAKMANIHSFIVSLPLGYETNLGSKGTQLSGGQKQRIAIARALVRNPKILLLDEATSALDLQSEKVVQAALDFACTGRTCVVIAHRLSTIQHADVICVFEHGQIAEQGTHQSLLSQKGLYYKLYNTQPLLE